MRSLPLLCAGVVPATLLIATTGVGPAPARADVRPPHTEDRTSLAPSAADRRAGLAAERRAATATVPDGVGTLYAVNRLTDHVVRFDRTGDRWSTSVLGTGFGEPYRLLVSDTGVAWVADGDTRLLVRVAPDNTQQVAYRWTGASPAFTIDRTGAVYVGRGTQVSRIPAAGGTAVAIGTVPGATDDIEQIGVDDSGRVTAAYAGPTRTVSGGGLVDVRLATFPAAGGTPTVREIDEDSEGSQLSRLTERGDGTIVLTVRAIGGSGVTSDVRIAPGSTTRNPVGTKLANPAYTFGPGGLLYLMEPRTWCFAASSECTPDNTVDKTIVYPRAGGAYGTRPVTGLQLPTGGIAVTADRQVFASENPASGVGELRLIPEGGGAAAPVLAGNFVELVTPGAR